MRTRWPDEVDACILLRGDGTVWRVRELRVEEERIEVSARLHSGPAGPRVLEDEILSRGDVVRWLDGDGHVVWSLKVPADPGRIPDPAGGKPGGIGGRDAVAV